MADRLANLIERARTWPQEAQEQAVASLEAIEEEMRRPYELSEDDRRAMTAASPTRAGRFVPEEEVARLFARFRSA